jgi:hypothetical protein
MKSNLYERLAFAAVRMFAGVLAMMIVIAVHLACANVKGRDTAEHADWHRSFDVATTQASDSLAVHRISATQESGGATAEADYTAEVTINRRAIQVKAVDHNSATTQPTIVNVDASDSQQASTSVQGRVSRSAGSSSDETTTGPTATGLSAGKFSVDGLSYEASRSKLADRWVIVLILIGAGCWFTFMPPPIQSVLAGIGYFAAAAFSLVASNPLVYSVVGGAILVTLVPYLRNSGFLTRLTGQMKDWISDAPEHERQAFDSSISIAGASKRGRKFLDRVAVEAVHSGKVVPVPAVSEVAK